MKKLILILIVLLLFLTLIKISIAQPPPPPAPPSIGGDVSGDSSDGTTESCNDNIKNQDETDVDCGGSCDKCPGGKSCLVDSDCESDYCNPDNKCSAPSCNDGWRNGNETDVDCGESCGLCPNSAHCLTDSDCESNYCNPNKRCAIPSQNGGDQGQDQFQDSQTSLLPDSKELDGSIDVEAETKERTSDISEYQKKENNTLLIISLIFNFILFGLLITIFLFIFIKRQKIKEKNIYQRIDLNFIKLKSYIASSLKQGYSPKIIKQTLLRNNWPEQEINQAFTELRKW